MIEIGKKIAVRPRTKPKLAILEPSTLPITKPDSSFIFAIILTTSSGNEVPNATIVIPTIIGEILNEYAKVLLPLIRYSAP